jgi:hypothetical protein
MGCTELIIEFNKENRATMGKAVMYSEQDTDNINKGQITIIKVNLKLKNE